MAPRQIRFEDLARFLQAVRQIHNQQQQQPRAGILGDPIDDLLASPQYSINRCYRTKKTERGFTIRESSRLPPNDREQARFNQLIKEKLAGEYIALFTKENISSERGVIVSVPCWEFIQAPTNDDVFRLFKPALGKECKHIYDYITASKTRLKSAPLLEKEIGDTFVGAITASIPKIPVSFPDSPNIIFDLCGEVLRLIPERDGSILNPYTKKPHKLSQLLPRADVVDILASRISDSMADTFEARYGIRGQLAPSAEEAKEENPTITFSFTDDAYKALLAEYENKPQALPLEYKKQVDGTWQVTLTIQQYLQMVQDNKDNVTHLLLDFNRYRDHLTHSQSSLLKNTVLLQKDLHTKKADRLPVSVRQCDRMASAFSHEGKNYEYLLFFDDCNWFIK